MNSDHACVLHLGKPIEDARSAVLECEAELAAAQRSFAQEPKRVKLQWLVWFYQKELREARAHFARVIAVRSVEVGTPDKEAEQCNL